MALNKKQNDRKAEKTTSNVRQLPSQHQNQILSALDTLGAKLVRSETERETMKRLLNEAMDSQDRLENQLERSHIDIQRRIDKLDETGTSLSDGAKAILDEHAQIIDDAKTSLSNQNDRQIRVEDKLRDSQQTIAKLQRRIDTQEQKRTKLQRRIERVENIAADAQNALEAKAMVLLTDQSQAVTALPHIDATAPMQALNDLHANESAPLLNTNTPNRSWIPALKNSSWLVTLFALGLGWVAATTLQPSEKAFVVMQDGTLAQINMQDGTATPITFQSEPRLLNTNIQTPQNKTIEDDLALFAEDFSTEWLMQDLLDNALNQITLLEAEKAEKIIDPQPVVETPDITMDRDLSLPANIKNIESKAFNNIAEAQHDLAALYTAGQAGVSQNYERASYWFRQAAAQGIANAAYNLGVLYHQGLGQNQDMNRALDWYRRASQLGHPEAQYNLGIAYIEGIGTRYNPNMAAAFFQQAAFGGIVEAAYNLGLILENGLLGEVRPQDALRWYRGAAEKGSIEAEQALSALAERLNITQSEAGILNSGETIATYIDSQNDTNSVEDVDLGSLVPTEQQIIVAQIQEQLRKLKYYNGPQDGIVGAGTVKSIKSYQIREGLSADGQASADLLSYMLSSGIY